MLKLFKKQPIVDTQKIKDDSYQDGFKFGYTEGLKKNEDIIQKKALDLYTNQNWLINPNHVFQLTKTGIPYLGQEPINKSKLNNLQQTAKLLLDSELWSVLTTLIRQKAIEKSVKESTEWSHVLPGKMMVHNISLIEHLVTYLASVDLKSIPDTTGGQSKDVH